jgi:cytochrome c553
MHRLAGRVVAALVLASALARIWHPALAAADDDDVLMARGAINYALLCAGCHGGNGGGDRARGIPALAGVSAFTLARQISQLKATPQARGTEPVPDHERAVAQLKSGDIEGIALYLASLVPPPPAASYQ